MGEVESKSFRRLGYRMPNTPAVTGKLLFLLSLVVFASAPIALANEPAVKKSRSGICHPKGGTYYEQTKHFIAFPSMDACIKSGGRRPKR